MRIAALALIATGCLGRPPLVEGFEQDFVERGGCADVYAFAVNEDDTVLLEVTLARPIEDAAGQPASRSAELPDPFATVSVSLGRNLSVASCNDMILTSSRP